MAEFSRLEKPVQFLKGVGPRRAEALGRMGIQTARGLLFHVPRRYDDASTLTSISHLEVGMDATASGRVRSKAVVPTRSGLRIFQAVLQDQSGMITVAWPGQPWLDRKIRRGDLLLVTGPVKFFHGRQLQPREHTLLARGGEGDSEEVDEGTIFVSYPASEEVPQWVLRQIFARNLATLLPLVEDEEYARPTELAELGLPTLVQALEALHRPKSLSDAEAGRRRLAYDELFFLQLLQARVRWGQTRSQPGIRFGRTNELIRPFHDALPFELTGAQTRALREIFEEMTSPRRMNRLLQGDVGAGKTVVALFAMLLALEADYQAALMAPTEILAEQHSETLTGLLEPVGVEVALLTGRLGAAERRSLLAGLSSGETRIVVGTHALIQESVSFARLGLVVVDEQHRFGVRQRMALGEQCTNPDVLVMSATPIPRSLAMTTYGDLDLSVLDEVPPGRRPIRTRRYAPKARADVHRFVKTALASGRQAYIVYPLVEESQNMELPSATAAFERLSTGTFDAHRIGLIHGQLPSEEKDRVMRAFRDGEIDVLVATSVVEVGIDVPNATVMVVEHAERFGLSQLHQLRGRVGRGVEESHCLLIAQAGEAAADRLRVLERTTDGFAIALEDLRLRGQGDLFGAQQHGHDVTFRFADLLTDEDLLIEAQRRARATVEFDPELKAEAHTTLRRVLDARFGERMRMFGVG